MVDFKTLVSRKGDPFGIIKVEDFSGTTDIRLFGNNFKTFAPFCKVGESILVKYTYQRGRYAKEGDKMFMTIQSISPIEEERESLVKGITLKLEEKDILNKQLEQLLQDNVSADDAAKNFSVELMNNKENRVVFLQSQAKLMVSKPFLFELDDMGICYSFATQN